MLRAARERAGLTQRAVALALGVAGGERVSAWEAGRGTPRDTQLAPLAKILNLTVEEPGNREPPLRLLGLRAGLSVPTFAAAVGLSVRTVFRWESGEYVLTLTGSVLDRWSDALDAPSSVIESEFRRGKT
ncbi:helix-turn-helix transcriptional regulator [uncultured Serinicoccus sp.]|uniref:helix-turn-helix transcriptional regulator n=1 Tax=uncultured Serinicoccus sp. TaxID=735514 RepID=UPI003443A58E